MLQQNLYFKEQLERSSSGTTGKLLVAGHPFALALKTCCLGGALESRVECHLHGFCLVSWGKQCVLGHRS